MRIPVVASSDQECFTCTRRTLLRGIGVTVAGSLVASACGSSGEAGVDAPVLPPDTGVCPTQDLCIDITQAPNTALATVNGSVYVSTPTDKLIVIRTSTTAVTVLSAVCTHAGFTVSFAPSPTDPIICHLHGAQFSLTGAVVRGPASQPLKSYVATLSGNTITIVGA